MPEMSTVQIRQSFAGTSAIGRSWLRDIAGQYISSPLVNELLTAVDAKKRAVILTGVPGSGKTCVMLSLQEALEQRAQTRADLVPLFIQAREFADLETAQERQAQGLTEQWVEKAARLAEDAHVVVVIDSLDVLSIAREHSALTYFLAQIDRLLLIPNVTVITACRDFDRKYDRRIAAREWDCELQCIPLDWTGQIVPLLDTLGIDTSTIDAVTRELISNPRELALFVDLAQLEGSFNVVTSQALAQLYLDTVVRADPALGEAAMQAIETMAGEMLKSRSLSIPRQRLSASPDILRRLYSLNVLQDTHDEKLTFGHQTLLDVLVISGAIRQGMSLNDFINGLQPVPFVRPSIRSFVAQLATGCRREFRKQLRTVLAGDAAFHIRRLVAESFAGQVPLDDDWSLIRDLRDKHREVFQVIYTQATLVEWHHFWLSHLVPALKEMSDGEGLTAHVHRSKQWIDEDASGVIAFWTETLALDWLDENTLSRQLDFALSEIKTEYLSLVSPLVEQLLNVPRPEHSRLGRTIARCITAGTIDDTFLWRYIAGDIKNDDVIKYQFDKKLHCKPHEFGDKSKNFLSRRMVQSTTLLDLALESTEQWSEVRSKRHGATRVGYRHGYLGDTSYNDAHSQNDHRHVDAERVLFDAIEAAVLDHAQRHSEWWQKNRERLAFSHEGALVYFAVLALTKNPQSNIELVGHLLCDRNLLEFELSYELSELIRIAFIYLDRRTQDTAMEIMQVVWSDPSLDERTDGWILKRRAEYISAVPCHLRSVEVQAILVAYEKEYGTLSRRPAIGSWGGVVRAPFSIEVFLTASDEGVINLLNHYSGYKSDFDEILIGGEQEVGFQIMEASSRHPMRFLKLQTQHWSQISASYRNAIMDGIVNYLAHRHGNLQPKGNWVPMDEPDAHELAVQILDELERHYFYWQHTRSMAKALEACAHVIQDAQSAERLVFLAIGFESLREESTILGDSAELLGVGINMRSGNVAEALMILANSFQENGIPFPELLPPTLGRFAGNDHPAIRALILRRLPFLQSKNPELGWDLFHRATKDSVGLWKPAERCLYYAYRDHFEKVAPSLERICREGSKEDMETWGRISALAALTGHIDLVDLIGDLNTLDITEAWQGAASVWTHTGNIKQHREQCLAGIAAGLRVGGPHSVAVAQHVAKIFRENTTPISIPAELVKLCFSAFEDDCENRHDLFGFDEWLNAISQRDPEMALAATEIYLAYVSHAQPYIYDHANHFVQLMTRLFAEAEEREESDQGAMLARVVSAQDLLLSLGLNSINEWLKAAERQ